SPSLRVVALAAAGFLCGGCRLANQPAADQWLFVANYNRNEVLVYRNPDQFDANVPPTGFLTGAAASIQGPTNVAVSRSKQLLFVSNFGNSSITVYEDATTVHGPRAPVRTVKGDHTSIANPTALFLDERNNLLYVSGATNNKKILVFSNPTAPGFNGDVAPLRAFGSAAITVSGISGLFID